MNKRILVISDLHIPFHHRDSFDFLKEIKKFLYNTTTSMVVILKDIILENGTVRDVHIEDGQIKYVDPKQEEIERIKNLSETVEGN